MIFKFSKDLESKKERNFYYKVFAGYLLNELLPEYKENKAVFFNLLVDQCDDGEQFGKSSFSREPLPHILHDLSLGEIKVSFDYHPIQIIEGSKDRGEMSDIVIWGEKSFVSIEAKFLTDWDFNKDIIDVQRRICDIEEKMKIPGIQVLLIANKKWKNVQTHNTHPESNLTKLREYENDLQVPIIVITWEQISQIIHQPIVNSYIEEQLNRL